MTDSLEHAPPPEPPKAMLWSAPDGKSSAVLLGPHVGLWVHWFQKRTQPCLNDRCPSARHRAPVYWCGYFPGAVQERGGIDPATGKHLFIMRPVLVTVNNQQAEDLKEYFQFPLLLAIEKRAGKRGFKIVSVKEIPDSEQLPEPFEVWPSLYRAFRMRPPRSGPGSAQEEEKQ